MRGLFEMGNVTAERASASVYYVMGVCLHARIVLTPVRADVRPCARVCKQIFIWVYMQNTTNRHIEQG